jgi:hypothetical protein
VALKRRAAEAEKKWARSAMALPRPTIYWAGIHRGIRRTLSMENTADAVVFCEGALV